ncbi:MAG: hypothetical protein ACTSXH_17760 [Promethearchaeota archaeon]
MSEFIIIDITDNENIVLDATQQIKSIKCNGTLLVKNPTKKSRLWNLTCDLKETVNTNLSKILNIGTINPGQEFKQEYQIQNIKEPSIKVEEIFDVEREITDLVNNAFLNENVNKCSLKIIISNPLDNPIENIKVTRELPKIFQEIEIKTPNHGTAEIKEQDGKRFALWEFNNLGAREKASLEIHLNVTPTERKDISLGALTVEYLINNRILTIINPLIRGLTDSMSGVERDEGARPGTWDCTVEFINDSEFKVRLEKVQVSHKIPTGSEVIVSESPNIDLNPEQSWSHDFNIDSANVPELESEISFTPLFKVITRLIGVINKEPTYYPVLSAEITKTIEPPEVVAYANTDMKITNTIFNKGTSPIDSLEIEDEIPEDFIPPSIPDVKLIVKNPMEVKECQERSEYLEKISITPDDVSPDTKHVINIKLKNMEKELPPNAQLLMTYPLKAKNPKPEVRYNTPVVIKANSPIKGKEFVISPPEEPVIGIKYVKRRLKTLKSIKPGINEGEFDITIRLQNKGEIELENIVVRDVIPAGFTLTETGFNFPYDVMETGTMKEIVINIKELQGNESINIKYTCSGQGEYPRAEPNVIVKGRVSLTTAEEPEKPEVAPQTELPKPSVPEFKKGVLNDIFNELIKKVEEGIEGHKLAELIEEKRDKFPPGPILHQLIQYANELKEHTKFIVGNFKDEVLAKIKDFQSKYD